MTDPATSSLVYLIHKNVVHHAVTFDQFCLVSFGFGSFIKITHVGERLVLTGDIGHGLLHMPRRNVGKERMEM